MALKITRIPRYDTEFYFGTNPLEDHSFLLMEIQRHVSWNVPVPEYHAIFLYMLMVFLFCHLCDFLRMAYQIYSGSHLLGIHIMTSHITSMLFSKKSWEQLHYTVRSFDSI